MPGGNVLFITGEVEGEVEGALTEGLLERGVMVPAVRTGFPGWEALLGIPVKPTCMPVFGVTGVTAGLPVGVTIGEVVAAGVGRSALGLVIGFAFVVTTGDEPVGPPADVFDGVGLTEAGVAGFTATSEAPAGGTATVGLFTTGAVTGPAGLPGTFVLALASGLGLIVGRLLFVVGVLG